MRDWGLYIVAVLLGALLGASGGVAAGFAVSQTAGGSPTRGASLPGGQQPAPPDRLLGDQPAPILYPDTFPARERVARPEAGFSRDYTPSRAHSANAGEQPPPINYPNTFRARVPGDYRSSAGNLRDAKDNAGAGFKPTPTGASPPSYLPVVGAVGISVILSSLSSFFQAAREAPSTFRVMPLGDVNLDGLVNVLDLRTAAAGFGAASEGPPFLDLNLDGVVDVLDLAILAGQFGKPN